MSGTMPNLLPYENLLATQTTLQAGNVNRNVLMNERMRTSDVVQGGFYTAKQVPDADSTTKDLDDGDIDVGKEEPFEHQVCSSGNAASLLLQQLNAQQEESLVLNGSLLNETRTDVGVHSDGKLEERVLETPVVAQRRKGVLETTRMNDSNNSIDRRKIQEEASRRRSLCSPIDMNPKPQKIVRSDGRLDLYSPVDLGYHSFDVASIGSSFSSKFGSTDSIDTSGRKSASPVTHANYDDTWFGKQNERTHPVNNSKMASPCDGKQQVLQRTGKPPPLSLPSGESPSVCTPITTPSMYNQFCFPNSPFYRTPMYPSLSSFSPSFSPGCVLSPFPGSSPLTITADAFFPPTPTLPVTHTSPYGLVSAAPPTATPPCPGLPHTLLPIVQSPGFVGHQPTTQHTMEKNEVALR